MRIFKAFALTGRRAKCCLYPGCCPGLGASALSGREGYELLSFYFLPFNFYNVVSAMFSRQSSVLVVLDFLDRNEDG